MPSTRRSRVSGATQGPGRNDVQTEPSAPLSPKITRSGRVVLPQDSVEQESIDRSGKRRKTVSPAPPAATCEGDVGPQHSQILDKAQQVVSSDAGTADANGHAESLQQEGDAQEVIRINKPVVPTDAESVEETLKNGPPATSETFNVPALNRFADKVLDFHIQLTPQVLGSYIKDPTSGMGKEYLLLLEQFAAAKQKHSGSRPFLSPSDLGSADYRHIETCRRVNLATFAVSLFDGRVGLDQLDSHFLFLFVPRGGSLSMLAASLWLELKTQAFIAAVVTSDPRPLTTLLAMLFTEDVQQRLLEVRSGSTTLEASEDSFILSMRDRRKALQAELATDSSKLLPNKYRWEDFLKEAMSYVRVLKFDDGALSGSERLLLKPRQGNAHNRLPSGRVETNGYLDTAEETFTERLARCALLAIQSVQQPYFTVEPLPWPLVPYSTQLSQEPRPVEKNFVSSEVRPASEGGAAAKVVPHSSQTAPTLVLLQRARQASETEALHPPQITNNDASKGERRQWTVEEEEALLEGLDRVRGPHWGQILGNTSFKDFSEKQLKDKAQSLKLFFLKAGVEAPFYLKEATGAADGSRSGSIALFMKQEEEMASVSNPDMRVDDQDQE